MEKLGLETLISSSTDECEGNLSGGGGDARKMVASRRIVTGAKSRSGSATTDAKSRSSSKSKSVVRAVRPDLGSVLGSVPSPPATKDGGAASQPSSTLGTLSSLLFGRKGGLL